MSFCRRMRFCSVSLAIICDLVVFYFKVRCNWIYNLGNQDLLQAYDCDTIRCCDYKMLQR